MINYGKHFIDRSDIKHVLDTLNSDWLTQGPKVKIFEDKLKNFLIPNILWQLIVAQQHFTLLVSQ